MKTNPLAMAALVTVALALVSFTAQAAGAFDGTDQKVTGHSFDSVAVTVDGNTVQIVYKLKGKVLTSVKCVVSGDSMAREFTDLTGSQPFVEKMTLIRVSAGAAGSHPHYG